MQVLEIDLGTAPALDPIAIAYRALAAAVIIQAVRDAGIGNQEAIAWLYGPGKEWIDALDLDPARLPAVLAVPIPNLYRVRQRGPRPAG